MNFDDDVPYMASNDDYEEKLSAWCGSKLFLGKDNGWSKAVSIIWQMVVSVFTVNRFDQNKDKYG